MNDDKIKYELEHLRHEYNLIIAKIKEQHQLDLYQLQSKIEAIEAENNRLKEWKNRQDSQLNHLLEMSRTMERESQKAITPANIRNWIIGLASLIGAILLILSTIESYNQFQLIKHEEKRWMSDLRQEQENK